MKYLGLDFDNTLVCYDELFHKVALENKMIDPSIKVSKVAIRNYLKSNDQESKFTYLQGEVYGRRILEAKPAPGVIEALHRLHARGIPMILISHKTKFPYRGPQYNLHDAAISWLEKFGFFSDNYLSWKYSQVYFEETKNMKLSKINSSNLFGYVDDLPEIVNGINNNVQRILYDPQNVHRDIIDDSIYHANSWDDIYERIIQV
jgi:hypothetical protein